MKIASVRGRREHLGRAKVNAIQNTSFLKVALLGAVAATLLAGCGKKDDPVTQAEKKDVAPGVPAPCCRLAKARGSRRRSCKRSSPTY
jgi:hypothetical protein